MKIAVIGGTGGMGQTLIEFFHSQNIQARPIGRKTKNPEQILNFSDVVVISVPSAALPFAIKLLDGVNLSKKLIVTLGSVMLHDQASLKSVKAPILHLHQLFGPKVFPFAGRKIIISGATNNTFAKKIINFFKEAKAIVTLLSQQKHDQLVAFTQALSQFSAISLAKTLSDSKIKKKALMEGETVTFHMNTELIRRILSQKPELWALMQFENKFFGKILDTHLKNILLMKKMTKNKDYKSFERMFKKLAIYWK